MIALLSLTSVCDFAALVLFVVLWLEAFANDVLWIVELVLLAFSLAVDACSLASLFVSDVASLRATLDLDILFTDSEALFMSLLTSETDVLDLALAVSEVAVLSLCTFEYKLIISLSSFNDLSDVSVLP